MLVVDDEPLGRERIRSLLESRDDVEVKAEAEDGLKAVELLQSEQFDLVFLDIQMPHMTGLEVVREVGAHEMPTVIFCTAHDDYAVEAFKLHALDYLLKPFERDRFFDAVDRVVGVIQNQDPDERESRLLQLLSVHADAPKPVRRFMIKSHQQITFVKAEDINWIEAAGNYVNLHTATSTHLLRQKMKEIEGKLDPALFLRIHRSSIINMDRVRDLRQTFNGEYEVRLQGGQKLTMSRNYRKGLDRFS